MISITLPSLYPNALDRAMRNIKDTTRSPYEVIVVSPYEPQPYENMIWLKETKSTGCNAAHMAAMAKVSGEFVTGWTDDHIYLDGWDEMALEDFLEREALFHAKCPGKPFELGFRHIDPTHVGTAIGIYYPYFPFMRTSAAKAMGWLTDEYQTGFADGNLAMRVWDAGGRCEWTSQGIIITHGDDQRKNMSDTTHETVIDRAGNRPHCRPDDMGLFTSKWASKYGIGWDTSHLRGFNKDITPERFPQFMDETKRTIYYNRPDFIAAVGEGG
jgi:hypothetical protein